MNENTIKDAEEQIEEVEKLTLSEDEPPKRHRGRPKGSTNKKKRESSSKELADALTNTFSMTGAVVSMLDRYDGAVILTQAEPAGKALAEAAAQNKSIYNVLSKLMATSAWAAVAAAIMPMGLAIAANHNMAPEMFLVPIEGVEPTLHTRERAADNNGNGDASEAAPFISPL